MKIQATQPHEKSYVCEIDRIPDKCPGCGKGIQPRVLSAHDAGNDTGLYVVFICPIERCCRLFVAHYHFLNPMLAHYHAVAVRRKAPANNRMQQTLACGNFVPSVGSADASARFTTTPPTLTEQGF